MHILNVFRNAPEFEGGIVKHLIALGSVVNSKGHRLTIAYANRRQWHDELRVHSHVIIIPEIEHPLRSGFFQVLSEICNRQNINVVHFHFYFALPATLAISFRKWTLPVIYHWHNPPKALLTHLTPPEKLSGKLNRFISTTVARYTDRKVITKHISMSREISELLIKNKWTNEDKIMFLPNSVIIPSKEDVSEVKKNKISIIGSVSNFRPQKDHETLIRAFKILSDWGIMSELWLVGDGNTKAVSEQLVKELGLASKVRFVGTMLNPAEIYRQFDVFALSTHYEGHSLVVLEAMSYGLPVVATRISSIPESITHDVNGLLVNPKDPDDLANALKNILTNQNLSKRLGEAARKTIEQQPSMEDWANTVLKLYEQVNNN